MTRGWVSRSAAIAALGLVASAGLALAQGGVPIPVPAPQPKSHGAPTAPRPPAATGSTQQQPAQPQAKPAEQSSSGFPNIFKPPAIFGGSKVRRDHRVRRPSANAGRPRQRLPVRRAPASRQLRPGRPDGGKSEGEFFLQKPGKVRFDYNAPSPIELIADGSSVVVRDRKLATQDLYPLSQTPLRFLLADRIDLMRDTNLIGVYADDIFVTVVIEERQILGGTHRVMLMFGAQDLQLRQWTVTDPQGYDTTVAVYNLDAKITPDPNMFRIDYTRQIQ